MSCVKNTKRSGLYLPAQVLVVHVADEEGLGGESVGLWFRLGYL